MFQALKIAWNIAVDERDPDKGLTVLHDGKPLTLSINVKPLPKDFVQARSARPLPGSPSEETYYPKDFGFERGTNVHSRRR